MKYYYKIYVDDDVVSVNSLKIQKVKGVYSATYINDYKSDSRLLNDNYTPNNYFSFQNRDLSENNNHAIIDDNKSLYLNAEGINVFYYLF